VNNNPINSAAAEAATQVATAMLHSETGFSPALLARLQLWQQLELIRPLDFALVQMLQQKAGKTLPDDLWCWLALGSAQLAQGHLCLDIAQVLQQPALLLSPSQRYGKTLQLIQQWLFPMQLSALQALLQQAEPVVALATAPLCNSPFVLEGSRLYLRRYWHYEQQIKHYLTQSFNRTRALRQQTGHVQVQTLLQALFPERFKAKSAPASGQDALQNIDQDTGPDWQLLGCAMAAGSSFSVITGGPGTGKTTTVVKLLLLLQQLQQSRGLPYLQIRLAAPTGKAAARLSVAITGALTKLQPALGLASGLVQAVPAHAETLHRLLGSHPEQNGFKYHAAHQLPLDVLVVDEASMVDVAMFAAMLAALPAKARLILLGDKDQLASVEAGAILAELCRDAEQGGYSADTADWLFQQSGQHIPPHFISNSPGALEQQLLMLRTSHRFGANSGIGKLAAAVNRGDADLAWQLLQEQRPDLRLLQLQPDNPAFKALVLDGGNTQGASGSQSGAGTQGGFRHYLQIVQQGPVMDGTQGQSEQQQLLHQERNEQWAQQVLQAFGSFQLLCALRQGEYGVEQLNQRISQLLLQERLIQRADGWYAGRPVMISQNDYATGLMNGDVGICLARYELQQGQWQQRLRVVFPPARHGEPLRWLMPSRLPALETVYAMTVHKSQGSEFAHAVLVLPDKSSVLLNRELVYTGITRAASCFTLLCPEAAVFKAAVQSRTERSGGLRL